MIVQLRKKEIGLPRKRWGGFGDRSNRSSNYMDDWRRQRWEFESIRFDEQLNNAIHGKNATFKLLTITYGISRKFVRRKFTGLGPVGVDKIFFISVNMTLCNIFLSHLWSI